MRSIDGHYNENMVIYEAELGPWPPRVLGIPPNLAVSAWIGMERMLEGIIKRFNVGSRLALEFGTEYGYSTVALSNFFDKVIGVDTFRGDEHSGRRADYAPITRGLLAPYPNIELVQTPWEAWTLDKQTPDLDAYDMIHVDVLHTYEVTLGLGLWACQHSRCVIFHDTMAFPQVSWACADIANQIGFSYFNYIQGPGLGILVPKE